MSDNFETMWNSTLDAFNRMVDAIASDAKQEMAIVGSGSVMGFTVLVPVHGSYEWKGMEDGFQAAKDAFVAEIWRVFESKEAVDREKWENEIIAALNESLEYRKDHSDPYDKEQEGYNTALDKVKEKIPAFVKGVKIRLD